VGSEKVKKERMAGWRFVLRSKISKSLGSPFRASSHIIRPSLNRSSHPLFSRRANFSSSSSFSRSASNWILYAVGASGCVGAALYLACTPMIYCPKAELMVNEESHEPVFVPLVEGQFVHPLDNCSFLYRMYIKTKRMVFLSILFVPCAFVTLVARITDSPSWRQYSLDMLVSTLEYAGCSFQKFAQMISMRGDVFPADLIAALSKLREKVPPHGFSHTRRMIKESFGSEIEDLFEEFDPVPIASGTVAQVHRARLRPSTQQASHLMDKDGKPAEYVAVKVRHPHVLEETWLDVDIIWSFVSNTNFLTVPFGKDEFLAQLQRQIDFKFEASNLQRFANNFKSEVAAGKLWFPHVAPSLLSSSILVESWCPGRSLAEIMSEFGVGIQRLSTEAKELKNKFSQEIVHKKKELANTVFDMTIKMFLRDNLVHGDLHSGNVLYETQDNCCTVIDAGLTTVIGEDIKLSFNQFMRAFCVGDSKMLMEKLLEFNVNKIKSDDDFKSLTIDIERACAKWVGTQENTAPGTTLANPEGLPISLGDIIGEVLFSLNRHKLVLRGDVASALLTLSISEGLILSLDPDFDVVTKSLPYFVRYGSFKSLSR
jgi:aarF domain-containing kinase